MKKKPILHTQLTVFALLLATTATTAQPTSNIADEIAAIMAKYDAVGVPLPW